MSKTSQRKQQAYREGVMDGLNDHGCRWRRHPFIKDYKRGLRDGYAGRMQKSVQKAVAQRWYSRLLAFLAGKLAR